MKKSTVTKHYREEAVELQDSLLSTMHDETTREKEITVLRQYLKRGNLLEVGCGNGAASHKITEGKDTLLATDISKELLSYARPSKNVTFKRLDVLQLSHKEKYDSVFTERCIINLASWTEQKKAIGNMIRALKKGGRLLLLESFTDGAAMMNEARADIGLPPIPPAYHNLLLDKEKVIKFTASQGLKHCYEENFLSSYYFGSRVLYPKLATEIKYNSAFAKFFSELEPTGNYSPIKLLIFSNIPVLPYNFPV